MEIIEQEFTLLSFLIYYIMNIGYASIACLAVFIFGVMKSFLKN